MKYEFFQTERPSSLTIFYFTPQIFPRNQKKLKEITEIIEIKKKLQRSKKRDQRKDHRDQKKRYKDQRREIKKNYKDQRDQKEISPSHNP